MLSIELNAYSHYTIKKSIDRQPMLSIIIPTYNRSTAITQCLNQLKAMSYDQNDVELILIDDSSTDNTYDVLQGFIADFSNIITLKRKENSGGASLPRNNGLKIASEKWILFIDSDDYITPHTLTDALAVTKIDAATDMIVCLTLKRKAVAVPQWIPHSPIQKQSQAYTSHKQSFTTV